jgi:hypothetical protein
MAKQTEMLTMMQSRAFLQHRQKMRTTKKQSKLLAVKMMTSLALERVTG